MTSRERWTVYPLLFLTLGITLKDKVTKEVTTDRVLCRSVWVTDREGKAQISLSSTPAGGLVRVQSTSGPLWLLGNTGALSGLMFVDDRGKIVPIAVRSQRPPTRGSRPGESVPKADERKSVDPNLNEQPSAPEPSTEEPAGGNR